MEDDAEEGEIREVSSPDDGRKVQDAGEPHSDHQPPEGEKPIGHDYLHGNEEPLIRSPRFTSRDENVHENELETFDFPRDMDDTGVNGTAGNGTQLQSDLDKLDGHNGPKNTPGLMKKTQLGKRDRNVRSPPSVGSVQVNCTRPRQGSEEVSVGSIDLNRSGVHQEPTSP
ncbi:hypothetical protein Hanom_Chr11g01003631 [Helianthus anomalus]